MGSKCNKKNMIGTITFLFILCLFQSYAHGAVPTSPAGLTAIAGNGEVSLTWVSVAGATHYVLYRGPATEGPYSYIAVTAGPGHTDRGLNNGSTHYYAVSALNADGESPHSAPITKTPTNSVLQAPAGVTAIAGNGQVSLAWNPVTSAVSYNVYRAASEGGPYTLLTPPAPGPSFTDEELTNNTRYFYVVQTMSTDVGAYSNEVNSVPSAVLSVAPTNVTVTPGSTWASLSWNSSEGATGYAVYRGTNTGGPYTFIALSHTNDYEDTGLTNGTIYYYVVAAFNANGRGAFSATVNAPVTATEMPHAPVVTSVVSFNNTINLCWNTPPGAVSYTVQRSETSGGPYTNLGVQTSCYNDSGLTNGTQYYYVVDVHNASPFVAHSAEVAATPTAQTPAPGNVTVTPGNTQASVTWDPVAGASSYYVTVAASSGGPGISVSGSTSRSNYTVSGLTNGQTYFFRVQAAGGAWSAFSAEKSVTPVAALPLAPGGASVTSGNTSASIRWDAVAGATGYQIYRRSGTSDWTPVPIDASTGTLFTDTGLTNGTKYYYLVAAVNENGAGAWMAYEALATPTANVTLAPTNVAVIPGNMQATVTWDPVVGASNYSVTVAASSGGPGIWVSYSTSRSNCTISDLTNGQPYFFRVQAAGGNWSVFSAEKSVTPVAALPLAPGSASVTSGNASASIRWDAVAGATGYQIYRRSGTSDWTPGPIDTSTGTLFTDTGLTNGTKYYYLVAAVNENGAGAWTAYETLATPTANATLVPTNVAVIPGNMQATVTWDPVVGASNYSVTVAASSGGPGISGSCSTSRLNCTVSGLTNGQPYFFRVQSGGGNWSVFSDEANTTPQEDLPLAPGGLSAIPGNTQVSIRWDAIAGATGYQAYRRTETTAWSPIPAGTSTGTLFTDSGLSNGTKYYYLVAAVNANGSGAWSANEVSGTPTADVAYPPANIAAIPGDTQVIVTWDPVPGASDYYVTVATSSGGPTVSGSSYSGGIPSFAATGLTNGQAYYFRVQSLMGGYLSAYSAEVGATPSQPANSGIVSGRVSVDIAGYTDLGVKNATVSLLNTDYTVNTDANGNFFLVNIPFGDYEMVITAPDMGTVTQGFSLAVSGLQVTTPQMTVSGQSCLQGDANGNDLVGLEDAVLILQLVSGMR